MGVSLRALCALGALFVVIGAAAAQVGTAGDATTQGLKPSAQAPAAYKKPVPSSYSHSKQYEQKPKYAPRGSYGSHVDGYKGSKYHAEESPYSRYDSDSHYDPDSPYVKPTYPTKGEYKKDEYKGSYGMKDEYKGSYGKPPSSYHHDSYDDSYGGDSYGDEPPLTNQKGYGKYSVELIAAGPNQLNPASIAKREAGLTANGGVYLKGTQDFKFASVSNVTVARGTLLEVTVEGTLKVFKGEVLTSGVSEGVARRQDVRIPTDDTTPNQACRFTDATGTFEGFATITTLPSPFLFNGPLESFIDDVTYNRPAAAFNIRILCRLSPTAVRRQQPNGGVGAGTPLPRTSLPLPDGQLPASGARAHRDRLRNATKPAPSMPLPDTIDAADRLPASGARAHRDRLRDAAKQAPMPEAPVTTPDTPVPTPDATDAAGGMPAPAVPGQRSTMPLPDAMIPSSGARARRDSGALPAPQPAPEARDMMPAPQVPALEGPNSEHRDDDAATTTPSPAHNLSRDQWMRV